MNGLILLYGSWQSWGGAGYWGPRFFLMPSVFSSIILGYCCVRFKTLTIVQKVATVLLLVYSFIVNKIGITIIQRYFDECQLSEQQCHLTWIESPFYVFTKPISEWYLIVNHQSSAVFVIGLLLYIPIYKKMKAKEGQEIR